MPKKAKRYRVLRVNMSKTLNPIPIEDWLNEAGDDYYLHDIIRDNGVILIIQAINCRLLRKRRRATKIAKKKAPTKKKTASKKTVAKKK